jgi:hypothetical protein
LLARSRRRKAHSRAEDRQAAGEDGARDQETSRPLPPGCWRASAGAAVGRALHAKSTQSKKHRRRTSHARGPASQRTKRERYELGDISLIKQRDQNRNVQISRTAKHLRDSFQRWLLTSGDAGRAQAGPAW